MQPQDRRLAGAGEADDARDRALDDVEREVLHDDLRAVADARRLRAGRKPAALSSRHCWKSTYESAKLNTKIRMIEVTTAPVVDLPTPAAPPRVCSPLYEPMTATMTREDDRLQQSLENVAEGQATARTELINES